MADIVAKINLSPRVAVKVPARQGLTGPPGARALDYVCAIDLGGNRVVVANASGLAIYADRTEPTHASRVIGITQGAASEGAITQVQYLGEMIEPSWSWTPGAALYLGTNGLLTETCPSTGFALNIAFAITATKIVIHIGQPIILT